LNRQDETDPFRDAGSIMVQIFAIQASDVESAFFGR
jgi:hypothetical protein